MFVLKSQSLVFCHKAENLNDPSLLRVREALPIRVLNYVSYRVSHDVTLLGNRVIEDAVSVNGVTLEESKPIILRNCHCQLAFRVTKETHPWVCL